MNATRWRWVALAYLTAVAVCAAPLAFVDGSSHADVALRLGLAAGQLVGGLGLLRAARARPLNDPQGSNPPHSNPWAWRLFAAMLLLAALATALDALAATPGLAKPDPGLTTGSATLLLWYPLAALGFRHLLRARHDARGLGRDAVALLDLSLLLIAVGVATFTVGFELYHGVLGGFNPGAELVVAFGFSALDLAILVPGLGMLIASLARRRGGLVPHALAALLLRPVADVLFAAALSTGSDAVVAVAQVLWWSSWVAIAPLVLYPASRAATVPSAPAIPSRTSGGPATLGLWRLVVLAGAALLIPLLVAMEPIAPLPVAARIARPLLMVSVVLVFARMTLVVRELQRSLTTIATLERERGDAKVGALVRHVSEIIVLCDVDGVVRWASPSLQRQLGHQRAGLLGRRITEVIHQDDVRAVTGALNMLSRLGPEEVVVREFRMVRDDGAWRHLQVRGTNLLGLEEVGALVLVGRDVTEQKTLEDQLRQQAFTDPLTGLANRKLFTDQLDAKLHRAAYNPATSLALLFIDLDDFKTVNDSLGHAAGDLLLITIAERLRACVRPTDTAARLGGDEFAVILGDADRQDAEAVAERILTELADPVHVAGCVVRPAASVGIALVDDSTTSSGVLLRNADIAMYTAKSSGKGIAATFRPDMHADAVRRLELKTALDEALILDQLVLTYQPIVDTASLRIVGAEALLRWQHPIQGLISPLEFIPLAEETGLIVPIGRWALREACTQALAWQSTYSDFRISVNLSGRQLQHPGLVPDVRHALADSGLPPDCLVLELTESVLLTEGDAAATVAVLGELRRLGVRLAIDDFGTGYSSLSYLQRLPVDLLKIDKSFIDALRDASGLAETNLLHGLLSLGESLGLRIVAEGVETSEQLASLRLLSCQFAQGYLFGYPMTPPEFSRLLNTRDPLADLRATVDPQPAMALPTAGVS